MSQIFEALQQSGAKAGKPEFSIPEFSFAAEDETALAEVSSGTLDLAPSFQVVASPERRLIALMEDRSVGTEKIRTLAAKLKRLQQQKPIKTILITSSIKGEGKSLVSANLAIALAKSKQQRVLLIDGDCRQPSLAKLLGTNASPGIENWWHRKSDMASYLRLMEGFSLWFLSAGQQLEQPLEMLQSRMLAESLAKIAESFDWVIIDSPPVAPLADSGAWATLADGVLLIVRQGKTPKKLLEKILDSIDKKKLLGIVLNESTDYDYGYYKQYYTGQPHSSSADKARVAP